MVLHNNNITFYQPVDAVKYKCNSAITPSLIDIGTSSCQAVNLERQTLSSSTTATVKVSYLRRSFVALGHRSVV